MIQDLFGLRSFRIRIRYFGIIRKWIRTRWLLCDALQLWNCTHCWMIWGKILLTKWILSLLWLLSLWFTLFHRLFLQILSNYYLLFFLWWLHWWFVAIFFWYHYPIHLIIVLYFRSRRQTPVHGLSEFTSFFIIWHWHFGRMNHDLIRSLLLCAFIRSWLSLGGTHFG